MTQVLNNQISNSARLAPMIKDLLNNGRMTIPQLFEVPSIKEVCKGSWNVSEAIKQLHVKGDILKLPYHDPRNMQIRYCYELDKDSGKDAERREVPISVIKQVNNLFVKPTVTVREHRITIELERFKITIED